MEQRLEIKREKDFGIFSYLSEMQTLDIQIYGKKMKNIKAYIFSKLKPCKSKVKYERLNDNNINLFLGQILAPPSSFYS